MIRATILLLLSCSFILARQSVAAQKRTAPDPVTVARSFLPPNTQLAQLYRIKYHPRWTVVRWPAVLVGHILDRESEDIVFAYYSPQIHTFEKTLFITLLHRTSGKYEQVYTISHRDQVLLVPHAMRIFPLQGLPTDAIAVIAGIGAYLGGQLQVFVWHDPWGWQNIFPPNGSMHYFYFYPRKAGLEVALSAARHPGLNVSPPPVWFQWNGKSFIKILPPEGSSKWPLPD